MPSDCIHPSLQRHRIKRSGDFLDLPQPATLCATPPLGPVWKLCCTTLITFLLAYVRLLVRCDDRSLLVSLFVTSDMGKILIQTFREIASGRFGARSMRTCLEHPNVTRLQHKRVAVSIILNSVNLATNPNGALLLTWLLDTSDLPGRYRLLSTRLAPHLAQLCPHKVASTTILKVVNQKVDVASSQMLVDAIFSETDPSILEDILSEQVHGSSFVSDSHHDGRFIIGMLISVDL